VPSWGNEGVAEKDKIKVHYRFLSFEKQQELLNPADIGKSMAYESRVLAYMIEKIDNLSIDDGDGERVIATGQELIEEPGLDGLALELWIEFRNVQSVNKKKLK
jgi:hypothetical protein